MDIKKLFNKKIIIRVFLPIILLSIILRFTYLDARPPHHDEGVNGWFVSQMWDNGFYKYDPGNYHGPLYFYFLQLSELVFGRGVFSLRFITAIFALFNIFLILKHYKFFGRITIWASLLMAVSPAMVFYGRYAIHESLLVTFQLIFSYGFFLHHFGFHKKKGIVLMTIGVFGAFLTKETFFIFFGTWIIALILVKFLMKDFPTDPFWSEAKINNENSKEKNYLFALISILICLFFTIFIYTGFFMNPHGFKDMIFSLLPWVSTGIRESGHNKPLLYWFGIFRTYEWPIFLSLIAIVPLIIRSSFFGRFWAIFGIGLLAAFSIIPYKTPWLVLTILWPFYFVFGYSFETLLSIKISRYIKITIILLVSILIFANFIKSINLNFFNYADHKEPYNYVHTDIYINHFMDNINRAVTKNPEARNMKIKVLTRETWPLSWLLGDWPFSSFAGISKPFDNSDVLLMDIKDEKKYEEHLNREYYKVRGKLRDSYNDVLFYYKYQTFENSWIGPMDLFIPDIEAESPGENK